jgi:hypothetical protein
VFLSGSNAPKNFNPYSYGWAKSKLPMTWEQARAADAAIEARMAAGRRANQAIFDAQAERRRNNAPPIAKVFGGNIALRR